MNKRKRTTMLLSMGAMALMVYGCGGKKIVQTEVAAQPATQELVKVEKVQPVPLERYEVKKGDTLWAISFLDRVYSDSNSWPLLFKTNRDQIQDPDLIEPGQVLLVQKGQTTVQKDRARQLADDTPSFKSHADPRKPLPLDYF